MTREPEKMSKKMSRPIKSNEKSHFRDTQNVRKETMFHNMKKKTITDTFELDITILKNSYFQIFS